ncbi:putative ribonuclease H-like domain-containing protein [Tanacetum coccineum]
MSFKDGKLTRHYSSKSYKGDILLVQVYVDDIIFGSTKKELCIAFKKLIHEKFQMSSMGELTFFLGLQVQQKKDGIFIRFTEVKTAITPIETQKPLLKDEDSEEVDVHMYSSMIGSLMYLTSSRPDIMFVVCACARYQVNPKVLHLHAMKRIFSMVVFLSKPAECEGFEQIVYFLNANPIRYALTINPTIYTSCIEQFWATVKAKTLNGEVQLQALLDGKKITITESITTAWNEFSSTMAIRMVKNLENVSGKFLMYPRNMRRVRKGFSGREIPLFQTIVVQDQAEMGEGTSLGSGPTRQETMGVTIAQTRFENISKHFNDPLLARGNTLQSGEDILKLEELMALCTTLQSRVIALETTKTSQAEEIVSLKRRVKKLEKRNKSRTHGLKRLYRVSLSRRVESYEDEGLGEEDASKQGRIADIDANKDFLLDNVQTDEEIYGVNDLDGDEVIVESVDVVKIAKETRSMVEEVTAVTIPVSAAITTTTTAVITHVKMDLAQHERSKGKMVEQEPVKKMSKKDLLRLDEELAFKLQAKEEDEEERLAREKAQQVEEANIAWDDVQAKIEAAFN